MSGRKQREVNARFDTDAARWGAVIERDAAADGAFVYSVRTTGIYCRPSCGSRAARRENVRFHESCEDARREGFRACRRCRPDESADCIAEKVAAACRTIDSAEELPGLKSLAEDAGMSLFHFQRVFKRVTGLSPKAYAKGRRAEDVRQRLRAANDVTEAFHAAGFGSSSRFYTESARMLGMQPRRFRDGGADETIRFAVGECSLGSILVAASDVGVCAIAMGDDPDLLVRDFESRFAKADLIGGDASFERMVSEVIGFVEAPEVGLKLPLDVRGTAFQRRVWQALLEIPVGGKLSYAQIAERLGNASASRAVAGACAANVLAVAIPCHRVIRTDGGISGYRWGVERKRELLRRERESVPKVPET